MRNRNLIQLLALTDLVEKTAKSLILVGELVDIVVPAYRSVPEAVGELLYSRGVWWFRTGAAHKPGESY